MTRVPGGVAGSSWAGGFIALRRWLRRPEASRKLRRAAILAGILTSIGPARERAVRVGNERGRRWTVLENPLRRLSRWMGDVLGDIA